MKTVKNLVIGIMTIAALSLALGAGLAGLAMFSSQIALSTVLPPTGEPGWPGLPFWSKWPLWLAIWFALFLVPSTMIFYESPPMKGLTIGNKVIFWLFWGGMIVIGMAIMAMYLGFTAALPAAVLLVLTQKISYTSWFPQFFLVVAGVLAMTVSWIVIRRAFYQERLAGNVVNIATSRARSVAVGLVELTGTAVAESDAVKIISGGWGDKIPESSVSNFRIRDTTGEIRVIPGEDVSALFDDGILLRRNSPNRRILESGDEVYVMGMFTPAASQDDEPEVRAMPLPGGWKIDRILNRGLASLNCLAAFYFVMLLHRIVPSRFILVISNLGERPAQKILMRRRRVSLALGLAWFFAGFLILTTGVVALSDDGTRYLKHFVWFFSWGSVF